MNFKTQILLVLGSCFAAGVVVALLILPIIG